MNYTDRPGAETQDDLDGLTPLKRAEEIVRRGPNPDGGPVPCADEDSPTCFTFTELNRARYPVAECGCVFEGGNRIGLCKNHTGAGPKVSYEDREEPRATWQEDLDAITRSLPRGEDKD